MPQLTDNLINKLVENHINFDVFNMQQGGSFLDNVPFLFQLVFFYVVGSFILNFVMQRNMLNNLPNMRGQSKMVSSDDINVKI